MKETELFKQNASNVETLIRIELDRQWNWSTRHPVVSVVQYHRHIRTIKIYVCIWFALIIQIDMRTLIRYAYICKYMYLSNIYKGSLYHTIPKLIVFKIVSVGWGEMYFNSTTSFLRVQCCLSVGTRWIFTRQIFWRAPFFSFTEFRLLHLGYTMVLPQSWIVLSRTVLNIRLKYSSALFFSQELPLCETDARLVNSLDYSMSTSSSRSQLKSLFLILIIIFSTFSFPHITHLVHHHHFNW